MHKICLINSGLWHRLTIQNRNLKAMPDTFGVILIFQEDTYLGQISIHSYVFF